MFDGLPDIILHICSYVYEFNDAVLVTSKLTKDFDTYFAHFVRQIERKQLSTDLASAIYYEYGTINEYRELYVDYANRNKKFTEMLRRLRNILTDQNIRYRRYKYRPRIQVPMFCKHRSTSINSVSKTYRNVRIDSTYRVPRPQVSNLSLILKALVY